jgi:hypothetical protein
VLAPGGMVMIDDVEKNAATAQFLEAHRDAQGWISRSGDGKVLIACLIKLQA